MERRDFLRILGIATLSPSVMIVNKTDAITQKFPVSKFNPKKWPIYPDRIQFSFQEKNNIAHTSFSYVKISRNDIEYLIPLKETCIGDESLMTKRFEWGANEIKDKFIVDESNEAWFDNGFIIKYNPEIHHN